MGMEVQNNSHYDLLVSNEEGEEKQAAMGAAEARKLANRKLWQWIVGAAGAGLLTRGLLGASRMLPETEFEAAPSYQPIRMQIPAVPEEQEKEQKVAAEAPKVLQEAGLPAWLSRLTKGLMTEDHDSWLTNWFTGKGMSSPYAVPALYAFGIPGAVGAFGATYGLTDKLLDRRRKAELKSEQTDLEKQYRQLMRESFAKRGSDVHAELDELAELAMEKGANGLGQTMWDAGGTLGGVMLGYAILSALASGKLSYDYFKKRGIRSTTQEAMRRRQKERFGGTAPIYLQPEPQKQLPASAGA
jgi:hypothetical protein